MSLGQIGEFSFIIAGVGLSLGVVRPFLYPVAVAVSALTTLLTPWLIRASGRFATFVDGRLPQRAADVRVALRRLGERPARDARAPDRVGAHPPSGPAAGRRRRRCWRRSSSPFSLGRHRLLRLAGEVAHFAPAIARLLLVGATVALHHPVHPGRDPDRARAGRRAGGRGAARARGRRARAGSRGGAAARAAGDAADRDPARRRRSRSSR